MSFRAVFVAFAAVAAVMGAVSCAQEDGLGVAPAPAPSTGTCKFTQSCLPAGLDSLTCTPRPVMPNETEPRPFEHSQFDVCAQYNESSCCSWQQRQLIKQNFGIIEISFGKLAGASGCAACAQNLKDIWCDYVCSPDQSFVTVHGVEKVYDPVSATEAMALLTTVVVDQDYACGVYESCLSVPYVQQFPPMRASCNGFLNYQGKSEGIGRGNDITFSYTKNKTVSRMGSEHPAYPCCNYRLPGASENASCPCSSCSQSCLPNCSAGKHGATAPVKPTHVPVLTGFDSVLVGGIYIGIAVLSSIALFWQRMADRKDGAPQDLSAA